MQRIAQDRTGYIWMGFYVAGLLRYDGSTGERYDLDDGLVHGTVREFVQDRSGRLWVGCETGVVVSDRPLTDNGPGERVQFVERVGDTELLARRVRLGWIVAHPDGGVVVGTPDGDAVWYRYASGHLAASELGGPVPRTEPSPVSAVATSPDGVVWLALEDGTVGWRHASDPRWSTVPPGRRPDEPITALRFTSAGVLLAGCRDGSLWRSTGDAEGFTRLDATLSEQVVHILPTQGGDIWAASLGSGVVLLGADGAPPLHITREQGLPSDTVWDVLEDREGTLWFAHNGGLSKLHSDWRAFSAHTARRVGGAMPALPDPNAFAVLPSSARGPTAGLWVGTSDGLVLLRGGRRVAHLGVDDGLPSSSVYALALEADRRLWIGTLEGLACLTFDGPPPPEPTGLPRSLRVAGSPVTLTRHGLRTVYQVAVLGGSPASPSVWAAGTHGLSALAGDVWRHFGPPHGLPAGGSACVADDASGHVWVGTKDHGLLRSRDPLLTNGGWFDGPLPLFEPGPGVGDQPPARAIQSLAAGDGSIWAATGAGMFRIDRDDDASRWVSRPIGRLPRIVTAATWDPGRSWMWTTSADGLQAVDASTNGVLRTVSSRDGLLDDEVWLGNALAVDTDGRVFVGTPRGVSV